MKRKLFFAVLGISTMLFMTNCSKSDNTATTSVEGKWIGNYNGGAGGPAYYFALHFEGGGIMSVDANNSASPDLATGTWYLAGDSVRATFRYVAGTMNTYSLAGRYSANSNVITGTFGNGVNTSGVALFTVTKQ